MKDSRFWMKRLKSNEQAKLKSYNLQNWFQEITLALHLLAFSFSRSPLSCLAFSSLTLAPLSNLTLASLVLTSPLSISVSFLQPPFPPSFIIWISSHNCCFNSTPNFSSEISKEWSPWFTSYLVWLRHMLVQVWNLCFNYGIHFHKALRLWSWASWIKMGQSWVQTPQLFSWVSIELIY